jgi:hypothetical protein
MEEATYFRTRSRESLVHLIRTIRSLQQLNDFPDSLVFQVILNVWELSNGSSFIKIHLAYMIEELRTNERHETKIKQHFNKEQ